MVLFINLFIQEQPEHDGKVKKEVIGLIKTSVIKH